MCDNINIESTVSCMFCKAEFKICYFKHDYESWRAGMLIQDAMPYLTDDQRELMISGICGDCWDASLNDEDEDFVMSTDGEDMTEYSCS